jgi:hypothetical protein
MKRIPISLIVAIIILSACTPAATEPRVDEPVTNEPATPPTSEPVTTSSPVDSNPLRGNVYLDLVELLTLEGHPLQFTLVLKGRLPTPCNQLRADISSPDVENRINVDVYSTAQADMVCAQVLEPFEENFPLGSFPAGHYTIWVNGELVAEFDS